MSVLGSVPLFAMSDEAFFALIAVLIVAAIPAYFLPSIIAYQRGHRNMLGVFLLNLFLGWALVGWVGALVWAALEGEAGPRYGRRRGRREEYDDEPNPFADPLPVPVPVPAPAPAPTTFPFACPACRTTVYIPAVMLGMTVACGVCGKSFPATPIVHPGGRR